MHCSHLVLNILASNEQGRLAVWSSSRDCEMDSLDFWVKAENFVWLEKKIRGETDITTYNVEVCGERDIIIRDEGVSEIGHSTALCEERDPVPVAPVKGECLVAFGDVEIVDVGMHRMSHCLGSVHGTNGVSMNCP